MAAHQPVTLAAMEGRFESGPRAPLAVIGQPNVAERKLDNPDPAAGAAVVDRLRRLLGQRARTRPTSRATDWPTNIELLYYSFHIMVGLGTLFIALMALAALAAPARGGSSRAAGCSGSWRSPSRFPYIANTAGWMTAELGRQPWLVYGLMRTAEGASPTVHGGTTLFTTARLRRPLPGARRLVPGARRRGRSSTARGRSAPAARCLRRTRWKRSGSRSPR